jgi:hypothetical protein
LRAEWLPILAGLIGSTVLSLAVTGLVMHWTSSPRSDVKPRSEVRAATLEPVPARVPRRQGSVR